MSRLRLVRRRRMTRQRMVERTDAGTIQRLLDLLFDIFIAVGVAKRFRCEIGQGRHVVLFSRSGVIAITSKPSNAWLPLKRSELFNLWICYIVARISPFVTDLNRDKSLRGLWRRKPWKICFTKKFKLRLLHPPLQTLFNRYDQYSVYNRAPFDPPPYSILLFPDRVRLPMNPCRIDINVFLMRN